ncbi:MULTISPECIES: pyridoxal phosphate-dependent aminotransferase [Pseudomonas]|uniref:pyridoxal phosphate-dependent aminotransferase n=1 Tax=Pseudomonas TaxID=286 RepID=UPI000D000381|nr:MULTISPECIES: pyridoxal phosphate-dependent aminotransferase [Pseudomonas]PRA47404.1 aspartate aminotransferase [Pseudomonas sp. MYb115]QXN47872.1 pyridoxal phosphate-dependent aminotransferase [Pseudomonas fluorescens]WSO22179.1 pyridoxal phosphate-dependent aminotransferase [Pseudomonas fluorescens]
MSFESQRVKQISSSPSMIISMRAKELANEGRDIVDMSLGEPDFDTPAHIVDAAAQAMRDGHTRYTAPQGTLALRQAIVGKFQRENGLAYSVDEITVGNGAKQVIFNTFMATLEAGDEVIIPAPYWVSYSDIVTLNGGSPQVIPCGIEAGFKLTAEALQAALTENSRWLILNSPSNPSGAIYTEAELQVLGKVLEDFPRVLVMSDEIYEHVLLADQPFVSFGNACPQLRERTLLINGVAKAYAMTGWRIGYAAGPKALIAAISKIQSQSTSGASAISQEASRAALEGPQDFVSRSAAEYAERGRVLVEGLSQCEGLRLSAPAGAFYAFPECSQLFGRVTPEGRVISDDVELSSYLLNHAGVAVVPGLAFGLPGYFRLSFATSREKIEKAVVNIREALSALR